MSWFSRTEDYSTKDSGFYGEPEITYGSKNDDTAPSSTSPAGAWDDYQREREYVSSCLDDYSR